ncbi:MAG: SDR family oxidoreductase [Candidatus Omnitrophica bacterium]|nr:SDR family oxidoreductase [Candidatus Omnitrophota bacterium]
MIKYLVTGGAGFIGSNIVEELVKRGQFVRVLDNLSTGFIENLAPFKDKIEFQEGDIRDENDVKKAVKGMDYVIHQAALRSVALSVEQPLPTNDVNVNGSLNVLIQSKEAGVKRLVYASSSSAYGDCAEFPQREDMNPVPISPYGVSKLTAELYARMFTATMGLETVSLRYFNVFGPRQNPESKYSAVIPAFIAMLAKNEPCTIDSDGKQSRDFTYVGNVVDANLAACSAPGAAGMVFNVACNEDHSVNDIAESLKKIMKKDIKSVFGPKRHGDVIRTWADISLMKKYLKIEPRVKFYEGLEKTVEWFVTKK